MEKRVILKVFARPYMPHIIQKNKVLVTAAILIVGSFFLFSGRPAQAFLNDYGKLWDGTLSAGEWNNLASDFLNKSGAATMSGPLGINVSAPASGLQVNGPIVGSSYGGSMSAGNISSGYFGSNTSGGNYSFPGFVGIGTSSPAYTLDVVGDINLTGSLLYNGSPLSSSQWFTNGLAVFYNAGNVGIGTSAPGSRLTVSGGDFQIDHNRSIIVNSGSSNTTLLLGNYGDAQGFGYGTSTAYSASLAIEGDVKGNRFCIKEDCKAAWTDIVAAGGGGQWTVNGSDMYNANSGNVGIGTTTPATKFQVYGGGTTAASFMNGNVGIGTTTPNNKLHVGGGIEVGGAYVAPVASGLTLSSQTTYDMIQSWNTRPLYINPLGSNNVIFSGGGNVGIGNTAPGAKLDVSGSFRNTLSTTHSLLGGAGNVIVMSDNTGTLYSTSTDILITPIVTSASGWTANGTTVYKTDVNGNVGIGTTSPGRKFNVYGTDNYLRLSYDGTNYTDMNTDSGGVLYIKPTSGDVRLYNGATKYSLAVYDAGNRNILLNANGTSYINGGNVGIGTTTPVSKLQIWSSAATIGSGFSVSDSSGNKKFEVFDTAAGSAYVAIKRTDNAADTYYVTYPQGSLSASNVNWNFGLKGNSNSFNISSYDGSSVSQRLVIANDGNVGIGTTNPLKKLQIVDSFSTSSPVSNDSALFVTNSDATANNLASIGFNTAYNGGGNQPIAKIAAQVTPSGSKLHFLTSNNYASGITTNVMTLDYAGNVGIGNTAPGTKLDVSGSLRNTLATTHSLLGGAGNVIVMSDNTGTLYSTSTAAVINPIVTSASGWTASGTTVYKTDTNGNVGIGTTNPTEKLEVNGDLKFNEWITNGGAAVIFTSGGVHSSLDIYQANGTTVGARIHSNGASYLNGGNVGIGTTNTSSGKLTLIGDMYINPADGIRLSSDGASSYIDGIENNLILRTKRTSGSDYIAFETSTTTRMFIAGPSGNIGIGTTNPIYQFQLAVPYAKTDTSARYANLLISSNDASNPFGLVTAVQGGASDAVRSVILQTGSMGASSAGNIALQTGGGNVGIGTTNPTTKLYVAGTSLNTLATTHSLLGGAGNVIVMSDNTGTLYSTSTASFISGNSLDLWEGTKNGNIWNGDAGVGNVGIGTTNPSTSLHIYMNNASEHNMLTLQNASNWTTGQGHDIAWKDWTAVTGAIGFTYSSTTDTADFRIHSQYNGNWTNSSTVNFIVKGNGNVGIGTTTPSALLSVQTSYGRQGFKLMNDRDDSGLIFQVYDPDNLNGGIVFRDNAFNSLNLGIGTTSPSAALDILTYNSQQAFNISADRDDGGLLFHVFDRDAPNGGLSITGIPGGGVNVGIGTTTPTARLTVTGANDGVALLDLYDYDDYMSAFKVEDLNGSSPGVIIKQTGNVGIAITNPTVRLDVSGTFRNTLATTHSLLGGAGNVLVMADNTGALYSTSTASFISGNSLDLWEGTKNGNIWNGDAGAGNVGIGTTNPQSKLHIANNGFNPLMVEAATDINYLRSDLALQRSRGTLTAKTIVQNGDWLGVVRFMGYDGSGGYAAATEIRGYIEGGTPSATSMPGSLAFFTIPVGTTTPAERMRINYAGNVGIGNTNPQQQLSVGDTYAQAGNLAVYDASNSPSIILQRTTAVSGRDWKIENTAGIFTLSQGFESSVPNAWSAPSFSIENGNVGIGISNPTTKLYVAGTSLNTLATTHSLLGGAGNVVVMADNTGALYATSTAGFSGGTNFWGGTKNGNIWNGDAGAGNVGIGTTAPTTKLESWVAGTLGTSTTAFAINANTATAASPDTQVGLNFNLQQSTNPEITFAAIRAGEDSGTGQIKGALRFLTQSYNSGSVLTEWMRITSGGNVGVGTTAPAYKLDTNGSFRATASSSSIILDADGNISIGI